MELNFARMVLRERRFRMVQMKLIFHKERLLRDNKCENSVYIFLYMYMYFENFLIMNWL